MATYTDEEYMWDILKTPHDISHKEYRLIHDKTWLTKERKVMRIDSMKTSHITNSIKMLERAGQTKTKAYRGLQAELKKRVDNGQI